MALAVLVTRVAWSRVGALLATVAALGGLVLVGGGPGAGEALGPVAEGRVSLAPPDRTGALQAARRVVSDHPLTGAGPGRAQLRWEGSDGATRFFAYAHNDYAQVAAELGLVEAAFAVHAGFDFVWHLPAVVLAMTVLAGIALPAPVPHSPGPRSPRKSSMKLRRRVAVAILIALLAAGSLAVLAPAGPAVAFSSGAAVP